MEDEFHGVDYLFARHYSQDPEVQVLLARLLQTIRGGQLALDLSVEEGELLEKRAASLLGNVLFLEEQKFYLRRHYLLRKQFYTELERISMASPAKKVEGFHLEGMRESQRQAILSCAEQTFWMITGGPGTGKSFTLARLIEAFSPSLSIVAVAPTGKATVRLKELLPEAHCDVMTIHRLLKGESKEGLGLLPYDLILVDESSMVDVSLFTRLITSIRSGARLVLVGDHEQLPPVEGASYFQELIEKRKESVTFLEGSMRVEKRELLELAERAKRGELLVREPLPSVKELIERFEERLIFRPSDGFEKLSRSKLVTPMRKGLYGSDSLNKRLYDRQRELYPEAPVPIMVTVNDTRFEVYNGDIGLLRGDELCFSDGRRVSLYCLRGYELAYALTVHKSQGSEYDEVVLLLPPGSDRFGRQLLYTAITRAKKEVFILG